MAKRIRRTLVGGTAPRKRAERKDHWTAKKREAFLAHLCESCNVTAAAASVGMGTSGLYQLRKREAQFRLDWDHAIREGFARLEVALLERAMFGTEKEVRGPGGTVDRIREISNRDAMMLYRLYRDHDAVNQEEASPEAIAAMRKDIEKRLRAIEAGRVDAAATAADGEAAGGGEEGSE